MTRLTFASLFTGLGGADKGAKDAGLVPIFGIEKDYQIVDQASNNFEHPIYIVDVRGVTNEQWSDVGKLDWLHASPPCTTATVVNSKEESQEDIELAKAVCRAIEILQPEYFSLENVAGYRDYKSFNLVLDALLKNGYRYSPTLIYDCSNYGVPQSRKRLFLVARKTDSLEWSFSIPKVEKTANWYDAIADLIPTLPECNLTGSQFDRLFQYEDWVELPSCNRFIVTDKCPNLAIQNSGSRKDKDGNPTNIIRYANEPIWTMRAMSGKVRPNPHQVTLIIDGKVLRPTVQCYARWQTFPDSYQFSGNFKLDIKGIGNAVPPLMFKQIVEAVLND